MASPQTKVIRFCYDLACPYAYLASLEIEALAQRCQAAIEYTPVLLGGIYEQNKAPQGKDGSASEVMSSAKQKLVKRDFHRILYRHGVTWPLRGPKKTKKSMTLNAMRALTAANGNHRKKLTHFLFRSLWEDGHDLSDEVTLKNRLIEYYSSTSVKMQGSVVIRDLDEISKKLRKTTSKVVADGAFGLPTFFIYNKASKQIQPPVMIYGFDRLFMVEKFLGREGAIPFRLKEAHTTPITKKLTFYYDFSSPWSFIGNQRLRLLLRNYKTNHSHIHIELETVPILLGALFKQLGTANAPLLGLSPNKQKYINTEMSYWVNFVHEQQGKSDSKHSLIHSDFVNTSVKWPDTFPIRTVTPLRALLEPKLRNGLYKAAWQDNRNIGDPKIIFQVLTELLGSGLEAESIMKATKENGTIKDQLFANTTRALKVGVCGVPSFQVDDGDVIFGQDRLNVVEDLLNGWKDESSASDTLIENTQMSKL